MTTMRVFSDEAAANQAAEALMAAGVAGEDIHLVHVPSHYGEAEKRVGTFDNEDARGERQGTFDNEDARQLREGRFDDTSGHRHNVREERRGSFADTEGLSHGPRHSRDLDRAGFDQTLSTAGINREDVVRQLGSSTAGVVLVVEQSSLSADEVARILG